MQRLTVTAISRGHVAIIARTHQVSPPLRSGPNSMVTLPRSEQSYAWSYLQPKPNPNYRWHPVICEHIHHTIYHNISTMLHNPCSGQWHSNAANLSHNAYIIHAANASHSNAVNPSHNVTCRHTLHTQPTQCRNCVNTVRIGKHRHNLPRYTFKDAIWRTQRHDLQKCRNFVTQHTCNCCVTIHMQLFCYNSQLNLSQCESSSQRQVPLSHSWREL